MNLKKTLLGLLAVSVVAAGSSLADPIISPSLAETIKKSSVTIISEDSVGNREAVCSGAVVNMSTGPKILTAAHCYSADRRYFAKDKDGQLWPLSIEGINDKLPYDYMILNSPATLVLPAIPLADEMPLPGDIVLSWISPIGLNPILSVGAVSGRIEEAVIPPPAQTANKPGTAAGGKSEMDALNNRWLADMIADTGASGAIVVNDSGEAVGMVIAGFTPLIKLDGAIIAPIPGGPSYHEKEVKNGN